MTTLEVELLHLSLVETGIAYRAERKQVPTGVDPDRVALTLAGTDVHLVHSTSWRYEAPATLVLTYVATPDSAPADAVPLDTTLVLNSGDALRPRPSELHSHHVAAHAVRHLAALVRTDPAVAAALTADVPLRDSIVDSASRMRTGAHEDEPVRTA